MLIVVVSIIILRGSVLNQANQQIGGNVNVWQQATGICTTANAFAIYHFDEGSGLAASDASGNGRNLDVGSNVQWVQGKKGMAIKFNGPDANTYARNINYWTSPIAVTNWAIEAWIYPTSTSGWMVIEQARGNNPSAAFMVESVSKKLCYRINPSCIVSGTTALQPNNWYHVAITYDGKDYTIYLNGAKEGTASSSTNDNWDWIGVGAFSASDSETFYGTLDEVKIYNYARTELEIANDYSLGC